MQRDKVFTASFVTAWFVSFCGFVSFVAFVPVLPLYVEAYGGGASVIGLLVGVTSLASLAFRPLVGHLVEAHGRKFTMTFGALMLGASSLLYNYSFGVPYLFLARIAAGIGISFFFTSTLTYFADIAPPARRGETMSYSGMATNLGLALGPLFAVMIVSSTGLKGLEGIAEKVLPGPSKNVSQQYNFVLLFAVSVLLALASFALAARLKQVFKPMKKPASFITWRTITNTFDKRAALPATVNGLVTVNFIGLNTFIPLYGQRMGVGNIGLYYTSYALTMVSVRFLGGRILDKFPRHRIIIPAMCVMLLGTVSLAIFQFEWWIFVAGAIVGAGHGIAQPGLQTLTVDKAKGENVGTAMATYNLGIDFGVLAGSSVVGLILDLSNFPVTFMAAGAASGLGAVVLATAVWMGRKSSIQKKAAVRAPQG